MLLLQLQQLRESYIGPFHATDLFWYLLKTSENQRFPDVFRGYQRRPVAWNGLTHHLKLHAGEKPSKCIFLITVAHEIFERRFLLGFVQAENINVKYAIFVVLRKAIWNVNSINMLVKEPVAVDIAIIFVQEDISWNFMKDYIGIKFYSSAYCEIFISRKYLSSIWEHTLRHSFNINSVVTVVHRSIPEIM